MSDRDAFVAGLASVGQHEERAKVRNRSCDEDDGSHSANAFALYPRNLLA